MSYKIVDNSKEIIRLMGEATDRGLRAIGVTAEGYAKINARDKGVLDTGLLMNSITYAIAGEEPHVKSYKANKPDASGETQTGSYSGAMPKKSRKTVYIGTNVKYAEYNELGTRKMPPRPFLKPAATEHSAEYKELLEESMKNA